MNLLIAVVLLGADPVPTPSAQIQMLRRPDVQKEIELLPDQISLISELPNAAQSANDALQIVMQGSGRLPKSEKEARMIGQLLQVTAESNLKALNKILLPHQLKRLQELTWQFMAKTAFSKSLTQMGIEVSESQLAAMKKIHAQRRAELAKYVEEHEAETRQQMMERLGPKERKRYEDLLGKKFEFSLDVSAIGF